MINLKKGENISLKEVGGKFMVGLSWDVKPGITADLDSMAICLDKRVSDGGKALGQGNIAAYFNANEEDENLRSKITFVKDGKQGFQTIDGAIKHFGDNRTGEGSGWDEVMEFDLSKVDPRTESILILVNIYDETGSINFGQVKNATVSIFEANDQTSKLCYDMSEDMSGSRCLRIAELYKRHKPDGSFEWKIYAMGDSSENDLEKELRVFGLPV